MGSDFDPQAPVSKETEAMLTLVARISRGTFVERWPELGLEGSQVVKSSPIFTFTEPERLETGPGRDDGNSIPLQPL